MRYQAPMRDRLTGALCNFLLNHVATEEYRAFVATCTDLGLGSLERKLLGTDDPKP